MKRKGLTLVEIIVSMLILGLVMLGLSNLYISSKRWLIHARARMIAAELCRYFVDPLQNNVKFINWSTSCLGSNGTTGCSTTIPSVDPY